ncbi:uncharacterized protein DSM5745_03570 [Aspergillus mulundensis]|uniref:Uncharacterized protein n=1 Tax=Aspergillus mulundensis TaxID=1810919 RepID=A0A3D8SM99_9EURO|nr:hypothetical protein DSM5745_03570 [Aspergillus mulundensis]RDW86928.1 hypothetical protein DSM5745_03570 [Aspergillus mulundensis]
MPLDITKATAVNRRRPGSSIEDERGNEAIEKQNAEIRQRRPGCIIYAVSQGVLDDFYASEEDKGPNRFGYDDIYFPLDISVNVREPLKQFQGKIWFDPLKYPFHDIREGPKGEAIATAVNKGDPKSQLGSNKTERTPGYKIIARNQKLLDGWYETCRKLGKQIWREEEDKGMNRFGYDGVYFDVLQGSLDDKQLSDFTHHMIIQPLKSASHDQQE